MRLVAFAQAGVCFARLYTFAHNTLLSNRCAIGQTFWTHSDSGRMQFNFSEILGNSTAVAISNAYYRDNRDAADALTKLGTQVGVDMAANILKEFSSDLNRKFFHRGERAAGP
jgi:hypothetical protein